MIPRVRVRLLTIQDAVIQRAYRSGESKPAGGLALSNYWNDVLSGRVNRRRALGFTGGAALGAAFLAACGGGSSGGGGGNTETQVDGEAGQERPGHPAGRHLQVGQGRRRIQVVQHGRAQALRRHGAGPGAAQHLQRHGLRLPGPQQAGHRAADQLHRSRAGDGRVLGGLAGQADDHVQAAPGRQVAQQAPRSTGAPSTRQTSSPPRSAT